MTPSTAERAIALSQYRALVPARGIPHEGPAALLTGNPADDSSGIGAGTGRKIRVNLIGPSPLAAVAVAAAAMVAPVTAAPASSLTPTPAARAAATALLTAARKIAVAATGRSGATVPLTLPPGPLTPPVIS